MYLPSSRILSHTELQNLVESILDSLSVSHNCITLMLVVFFRYFVFLIYSSNLNYGIYI
jgi:hypothetical protein